MRRISFWVFLSCSVMATFAQTTKEELYENIYKTGSNYLVYQNDFKPQTVAPKGYTPFYLSHYGRHGSRYYIEENDFSSIYALLDSASKQNALTTLGKDLKQRFFVLSEECKNRGGDLSPLGARQQQEIANRMFDNFPTIFKGRNIEVKAQSTQRARCVLSMSYFCLKLKELNPKINISMTSSNADDYYMCYSDKEAESKRWSSAEWKKAFDEMHKKYIETDRIIGSIFSNKEFVNKNIDKLKFVRKLYDIASCLQDIDHLQISLYDVFTKEELWNNWKVQNTWWYANSGPCPLMGGDATLDASDLLLKIIKDADNAVRNGAPNVSLRFGHDEVLMKLVSLMRLENCYVVERDLNKLHERWCDFKIIPMSANLQMIFYRKGQNDDVLVKFMLNENEIGINDLKSDIYPYYKWEEVSKYFKSILFKK